MEWKALNNDKTVTVICYYKKIEQSLGEEIVFRKNMGEFLIVKFVRFNTIMMCDLLYMFFEYLCVLIALAVYGLFCTLFFGICALFLYVTVFTRVIMMMGGFFYSKYNCYFNKILLILQH